jgi:hypothetical protein
MISFEGTNILQKAGQRDVVFLVIYAPGGAKPGSTYYFKNETHKNS